jgi:hypothetical protein
MPKQTEHDSRTLWVRAIDFPGKIEVKYVSGGGLKGPEKVHPIDETFMWDEVVLWIADDELEQMKERLLTHEWVSLGRP